MTELIWGILLAAVTVFAQMAPYLLLGFFLAGWLYVLVPREAVADHLGRHRRWGPVWAALVGIPLPLCSCGVLPFARLLKDRGASPGSMVSFLLTTPQTGIDSILVSASILGWPLTFWKIGTALVSGLLGGFAANAVAPGGVEKQSAQDEPEHSCCASKATPAPEPAPVADCCSTKPTKPAGTSCCGHAEVKKTEPPACCCSAAKQNPEPVKASCCGDAATKPAAHHEGHGHPGKLRAALYYGFFQNLGDVAGWLVMGLLLAGLISYLVPDDFFNHTWGGVWTEMLAVLAISMLIYVCATGSVPIGAALAAKGLSAGAVMVFLIAGPAVSAVSMAVLGKALGRRLLLVYLATIVTISVASGMVFNIYFPDVGKTILPAQQCEHLSTWQWTFAAVLGSVLAFHFMQRAARKLGKAWLRICPECLSFCFRGCACCGCSH